MREIKFRAWDGKRKEMLSSNCVNLIMFLSGELYEIDCNDSISTIDDLIVMQYTGLKDKNGTEIYEGDTLQWKEGWKYYSGHWVVYDYAEFKLWNGRYHTTIIDPTWYEVIGNIYENPELLEVK